MAPKPVALKKPKLPAPLEEPKGKGASQPQPSTQSQPQPSTVRPIPVGTRERAHRPGKNYNPGKAHKAYDPVRRTSVQKKEDDRKAQLEEAANLWLAREEEQQRLKSIAAAEDRLRQEDEEYSKNGSRPDLHPLDPIDDNGQSWETSSCQIFNTEITF